MLPLAGATLLAAVEPATTPPAEPAAVLTPTETDAILPSAEGSIWSVGRRIKHGHATAIIFMSAFELHILDFWIGEIFGKVLKSFFICFGDE